MANYDIMFCNITIVSQFLIAIGCKLKSDAGFRYVGTQHVVSLQSRMNAGFLRKLQKYRLLSYYNRHEQIFQPQNIMQLVLREC